MIFKKQTYGNIFDYNSKMSRNVELDYYYFQSYGVLLKVQIIVNEELEFLSLQASNLKVKWERMAKHIRAPDLHTGEKVYLCDFEEVGGIFLQTTMACAVLSVIPKNQKFLDGKPVPVKGTLYELRGEVLIDAGQKGRTL